MIVANEASIRSILGYYFGGYGGGGCRFILEGGYFGGYGGNGKKKCEEGGKETIKRFKIMKTNKLGATRV